MNTANMTRRGEFVYRKLTDNNVIERGFAHFAGSSVCRAGQAVGFAFRSGAGYEVPLHDIVDWYRGWEEEHQQGRPRRTLEAGGALKVVRTRRLNRDMEVRVYLSDGQIYDVLWSTVLMACEPRYEHFGGLTPESKSRTRKRWRQGRQGIQRTPETQTGEPFRLDQDWRLVRR